MADEMKELRGAVFDLIPDGVSVVALDEIEVDDMAPKTRNVKDEDSNKQHRVDDERFGGLVYKLPGVAVRCVLSSCYRPVWREFSFRKSGRF